MTMVMGTSREIPAARFKAQCLALLDDVAATGDELIVTKRGKPVARVVPLEPPADLRGSVTYLVDEEELIAPFYEDYEPPDFP
jgi:prevent-host-death family protein